MTYKMSWHKAKIAENWCQTDAVPDEKANYNFALSRTLCSIHILEITEVSGNFK